MTLDQAGGSGGNESPARTGKTTVEAPTHPAQEVEEFAEAWTSLWNEPHIADHTVLNHPAMSNIDDNDAVDDLLQHIADG